MKRVLKPIFSLLVCVCAVVDIKYANKYVAFDRTRWTWNRVATWLCFCISNATNLCKIDQLTVMYRKADDKLRKLQAHKIHAHKTFRRHFSFSSFLNHCCAGSLLCSSTAFTLANTSNTPKENHSIHNTIIHYYYEHCAILNDFLIRFHAISNSLFICICAPLFSNGENECHQRQMSFSMNYNEDLRIGSNDFDLFYFFLFKRTTTVWDHIKWINNEFTILWKQFYGSLF